MRINATSLVFAVASAAETDARVDWGATLWSGAVTVQPYNSFEFNTVATAMPGTIRLAPLSRLCGRTPSGRPACRVDLAHETVHIQQIDLLHEWIGRPIEDALLMRRLRRHWLFRHVELGAVGYLSIGGLEQLRRYDKRWIEYEASWLTSGRGPLAP